MRLLDGGPFMSRRLAVIATCLLCAGLVVALAGCAEKKTPAGSGAPAASAKQVVVVEENYEFTPSTVTVSVGDKVVFENKDGVAHRVSVNGQDLGQQDKGQKVTWTATAPGTMGFTCTIHPDMTGQITVK
jgi:plastocyanin